MAPSRLSAQSLEEAGAHNFVGAPDGIQRHTLDESFGPISNVLRSGTEPFPPPPAKGDFEWAARSLPAFLFEDLERAGPRQASIQSLDQSHASASSSRVTHFQTHSPDQLLTTIYSSDGAPSQTPSLHLVPSKISGQTYSPSNLSSPWPAASPPSHPNLLKDTGGVTTARARRFPRRSDMSATAPSTSNDPSEYDAVDSGTSQQFGSDASPGPTTGSGGISIDYATIAGGPPQQIRRRLPGGYSRGGTPHAVPTGPVTYTGSSPTILQTQSMLPPQHPGPPYFSPHPSQDPHDSPSPGYMGSPYGMPYSPHQYSPLNMQHAVPPQQISPYRGPALSPYAMTAAPGLPSGMTPSPVYPGYSQPFPHLGGSPEGGGQIAFGPSYSPAYTPSTGPDAGSRRSNIPSNDGSHGMDGSGYPMPMMDGSAISGYSRSPPFSGTPAGSSSPSAGGGAAGLSRASISPLLPSGVSHTYAPRISPQLHPHASPNALSPAMATFPQYPPGSGPPMAQYGYQHHPYASYSHPTSPIQPQNFSQYSSPSMGPNSPSSNHPGRTPITAFPAQQSGTWWYVPPGGGPPQPFPSPISSIEYQGPYTINYSQQTADLGRSSRGGGSRGQSHRGPPRYQGLTRKNYGRGVSSIGSSGRARGAFVQPRGGGPSGAGLAAGSPSGGSGPHSHPASSDSPSSGDPKQAFASNMIATRKGKEPVRQAFHPKPQSHGHEWVMWVGNIPDHATQEEVWNFFRNPQAVVFYMANKRKSLQGQTGHASPPETPVDGIGLDSTDLPTDGGVSSVFLIKSSNCAFVNFETEESLTRALRTFNGVPLRPYDRECPPLVCRIRRKDDDLRTGVAAQRGWGLHTNWIRLQAEAMRKSGVIPIPGSATSRDKGITARSKDDGEQDPIDSPQASGDSPNITIPSHLRSHDDPPTSPSTHLGPSSNSDPSPPINLEGDAGRLKRPQARPRQTGSVSSGSIASTNSSFLAKYFPKRYFILKSLSEHDLNLSVERGIWATQAHNEPVLDQAFRTSREVFLIFGANKSGEFYGYAKMTTGITKGEKQVSWASKADSGSSKSSLSAAARRQSSISVVLEESAPAGVEEDSEPKDRLQLPAARLLGSPSDLATSPAPFGPGDGSDIPSPALHQHQSKQGLNRKGKDHKSAPAELGPPYKRVTKPSAPAAGETFDVVERVTELSIEDRRDKVPPLTLDPSAPARAVKNPESSQSPPQIGAQESVEPSTVTGSAEHPQPSPNDGPTQEGEKPPSALWGTPFQVQWISTTRLPFARVKNIRNPWNYDREVKISRDGIELEPSVGEALLEEWDRVESEKAAFEQVLASRWYETDGSWRQGDGTGSTPNQPPPKLPGSQNKRPAGNNAS